MSPTLNMQTSGQCRDVVARLLSFYDDGLQSPGHVYYTVLRAVLHELFSLLQNLEAEAVNHHRMAVITKRMNHIAHAQAA